MKSDYESQSNGYHIYHFDNIGSTTAITSEAGVIEVSYSYGPYGELLTDSEGEDFLYNGAYGVATDDNGLYYMRARYYNPSIKRFINQDVVTGDISNSASLNRYAYCEGNPINQSDPFGLSPTSEDGSGGGDSSKYATLHTVLSIVGLIPGLGDVCDVVNAIAYFSEGDMLNCVLSLASALPGVGGVVAGIGSKLNKIGKLCKVAKACDVVGTTLKVAGKTVTAGSCFYESGKCAVDAYFAYEANGGKIDKEVLKKAGGALLYGALAGGSIHSAVDDVQKLDRTLKNITGCFVAGTKVATLDGYKNIEDIKAGDYVYSENPKTGEKGYKKVLTTYEREKDIKVTLKVTDEEGNEDTIETTIEHPFWVEELGGYVKAKDLEAGDHFRLLDGSTALLEDVDIENTDIFTVYNLEVEDWHTYYVGELSVLVHNMCASDAAAKKPKESVSSSGKKNSSKGLKSKKLYRGDKSTVNPKSVFENGFAPKGTHNDALLHTSSNASAGNFISTTTSKDIANQFAGKNGYVYVVDADNYVDINATYGSMAKYPEQLEHSIPGGVKPEQIVGAYKKKDGKIIDEFISNPNYGGNN